MAYHYEEEKQEKYFLFAIIFLAGIVLGAYLFYELGPVKSQTEYIEVSGFDNLTTERKASLILPAVDQDGNGVATTLEMQIKPGEGRILTNIDKLLFWVDTQYSIQTAKQVAEEITKISTKNLDMIYSIKTQDNQLGVVGGPSAGAALTIATIAALQNKTPNQNIIITGTIEADGSIGQVGGILEKASAAKDIGAELFLVPTGEGYARNIKPIETCKEERGPGYRIEHCQITYEVSDISIGEEVDIEVKEVATIEDAIKYFFE